MQRIRRIISENRRRFPLETAQAVYSFPFLLHFQNFQARFENVVIIQAEIFLARQIQVIMMLIRITRPQAAAPGHNADYFLDQLILIYGCISYWDRRCLPVPVFIFYFEFLMIPFAFCGLYSFRP